MIPDTRSLVHLFCVAIIAAVLISFVPGGGTAQGLKTPSYCASESSGPIVYFSAIFDTKLNQPVKFSSHVIAREFSEYLKGRYEYSAPSNYPAGCPLFRDTADAEASKRDYQARMRQANKQIVEVDWKYVVDEELIAASYSNQGEDVTAVVQRKRKSDHTYCLSESAQGTLYTTGPVETGMATNLSLWYRGFDQFLKQKYSFKEQIYCNVGSRQEDERIIAARVAGARAAGKKVVNTGWKYDPAAVTTTNTRPAQRDDDPEPVKRPASPNPSRQASDIAAKEMPSSLAYCQKDQAMATVFNCNSFARVVYNYRMAHLNEAPEEIASLVAANKLNCAECIDNTRVSLWVDKQGNADKLDQRVINCVSQNVIVTLYKKPEANHLKDFYKEAVAACRK